MGSLEIGRMSICLFFEVSVPYRPSGVIFFSGAQKSIPHTGKCRKRAGFPLYGVKTFYREKRFLFTPNVEIRVRSVPAFLYFAVSVYLFYISFVLLRFFILSHLLDNKNIRPTTFRWG